MKCIVVGLGIQGKKRRTVAGSDVVATVDPVSREADYRALGEVTLEDYDAALVCTPDEAKLEIIEELLSRRKHVLVEKPLLADDPGILVELGRRAQAAGVALYTAYNHRFEPHLVRLKAALDAKVLGRLYLLRGYYGNGTARDVYLSPWRDKGGGVLTDLGSHLLDTVHFLLGGSIGPLAHFRHDRFENRAWDHVSFGTPNEYKHAPVLQLEASLLSWRNTFALEVWGERGSLHVFDLCKWGQSLFVSRQRVLPSGSPIENTVIARAPDPTWEAEYRHFKELCAQPSTNIDNDVWILERLLPLWSEA